VDLCYNSILDGVIIMDIMAYGVGEIVFGLLFFTALFTATFTLVPLKVTS